MTPHDASLEDATYTRDVLDLLDRAGVPTTCPPQLTPGQVERVLRLTPDYRRSLERDKWLVPTDRTPGRHARYSPADLARAILRYGLRTYWDDLDTDD